MFGGEIELSKPAPVGPVEASAGVRFAWRAHRVTATVINDEAPLNLPLKSAKSIEIAY